MDTIDNYFTENPVDESTLRDVGDPTEHNRLMNELYRGAYRDGGFVSPTVGVTVEDTMLDLPHDEYTEMLDNEVYSKIGPSAFDVEAGDYNRRRFDFITGHRVFSQNVQKDAIGRNVIGYEFNLDNAENYALAAGVLGKTPKQMQALMDGTEGVSSRDSRALYEAQVAQADKMISELTDGAPLRGPQRMALTSLVMHNPALLGPNLVKHIKNGDAKKAITEIRDKSNGSKNKSLALRRKQEAMHFGNYSAKALETGDPELSAAMADHMGMPKPRKVTAPETSLRPQLRPNQGAKVEGGGLKRSLRPRLRPTAEPDSGLQSSLRPRMRPDDMRVPAEFGGVARSLRPQLRPDSVGTEALVSELEIALGVEKPAPVDAAIDNNIEPVVVPDTDGEITVTSLGNTDAMRLSEELGAAIDNAGMSTEMNDALKQISGSMSDKLTELEVDTDSAMFFDNTRDYIAARDAGELVEGDEIVIGTDGNLSTFLHTESRDKTPAPETPQPDTAPDLIEEAQVETEDPVQAEIDRKNAAAADSQNRIDEIQSVLKRNRTVLDKSNYTFGTITDTSEEEMEVTISTSGDVYDSEGTLMDASVEDGTVFNRAGDIIGSFVGEAIDVAGDVAGVAADYALDTVESVTKAVQSFGTSEFVNFLGNAARPGGKLTSGSFNEAGLDAMREAIRIARAAGRSFITYEDLGTTEEQILKEPLLKGLFDPETRVARGLGVFNFKMNDAGETVITDTYDFNEGTMRTTFYEALKSGREVDAIKALSSATLTEQASMLGFARQEELKAAGKKWQTDISINLGNMGDRIAANIGGVSKSKRPILRN